MFAQTLFMAAGFALLAIGAESLVRGSVRLSARLGIAPLVIGLTVVAFGTSTPELFVSAKAAWSGRGDIAAGNIIGSNIYNIAVILGVAALLRPIGITSRLIRQDIPVMIAAALLFHAMATDQRISREEGLLLSVLMAGYLWINVRQAKAAPDNALAAESAAFVTASRNRLGVDLLLVAAGIALLAGGSHLLVHGATGLARAARVSEAIIGLTIVAAGTGLPELAASVAAALRRQPDIAIGNVVGSNIFNVLGVGGLSALIRPLQMPDIMPIDLIVMSALSVILLPVAWTGLRLGRREACLLLASYAAYLYHIWPHAH